ncbi:hypothetical protein Hokovirus_3_297 [Hokovirus HKV1]|uniref:Uncharacterized protein n=1 Tax=Hokovirus HKV1 TaxID=1977638 RepID=A0A1V0SHB3_9VIRU|nr:hypothetical protein Hokovirus_3_297 [Hokovirus HKV1]
MTMHKDILKNTEILPHILYDNYMYLEILTKRLEIFEENKRFKVGHSQTYSFVDKLTKQNIIILKQLLEENLEQNIFPRSMEKIYMYRSKNI